MNLIRYRYPRTSTPVPALGRSSWPGLESEFDGLFRSAVGEFASPAAQHRFPVDLHGDKENTFVRADLPGLMREDVTLEMVDGYLTITAAYEHGVLAVTRSTPAFRTWSLRPGVFLVARVAGR